MPLPAPLPSAPHLRPRRLAPPLFAAFTLTALASPANADPAGLPKLWDVAVSEPAGAHTLIPAGDRLIVVTWQGDLVALDAATGKRAWRQQPKLRNANTLTVAVDGDNAVVGWPGESALTAHRISDGRRGWTTPLAAPVNGMAICGRDRVVVATHRGDSTLMATAVDPLDGAVRWTVPVDGPIVGAGDHHVFTAQPSGFGVWPGRLEAIECATGARRALAPGRQQLVELLAAGDGHAVTRQLNPGFVDEQICIHALGSTDGGGNLIAAAAAAATAAPDCFEPTDGEVSAYSPVGALIRDGVVYYSTAHIEAHNLNPAPDSWVFARKIGGGHLWRSPPLTSRQAPVDAGALLWTAFGTTGVADRAYLVDPASGATVGTLSLRKAPTALAADAKRAYVASYDGRIAAVTLPRPGRKTSERRPVATGASAAIAIATDATAAVPGGWTVAGRFDAHPKQAVTSGSKVAGSANAIAFVDAGGKQLVVGGNDDRVRVIEVATKRQLWISDPLGKDIEHVATGGDRIHARIYGGVSFTFVPKSSGWRQLTRVQHGHGWMTGLSADGFRLLADNFAGQFRAFDPVKGTALFSLDAPGEFDRRGTRVRGTKLVVSRPGALDIIEVRGDEPETLLSVATPTTIESGALTQAWMVDDRLLLREYCGPATCTVELVPIIDRVPGQPRRIELDVRGAGWVASVPSTIDLPPDASTMFFFRRGLVPVLIDLKDDGRIPIKTITGAAPGELTTAVFSSDGRRLALGMHPKSWQVTVIERR